MQVREGGGRPTLETIRFGEYLVERKAIDEEQLLDALADHWALDEKIGQTIARRGFLSREQVEALAAEYHGLEVVEIPERKPLG